MDFEWTASEISKKTVTIYGTNITLNKATCHHFENVQYVLLGLDKEKNLLGIKPITKDQLDKNLYQESQLHHISIGKSYARISNKIFIENLSKIYDLDLDNSQGVKFGAEFDVIHQILIVNLRGGY